jgi:hypothetical protein
MALTDRLKHWHARSMLTGIAPVWWRRMAIRIVLGSKWT